MNKYKFFITIVLLFYFLLLPVAVVGAEAYQTYTYTYSGRPVESANAYTAVREYRFNEFGEGYTGNISGIAISHEMEIFIADSANNRILILDENFTFKTEIRSFEDPEEPYIAERLSGPSDVFVTPNGDIYVADKNNKRIVVFDNNYQFKKKMREPKSEIFQDEFVFSPDSLVVDASERIYVIVENNNMGVVALNKDGNFESFLGAQRVSYSLVDLIWRNFMTREQIKRTDRFVPAEYNDIDISEKGFLFVTSSAVDPWNQYSWTVNRMTNTQFAPVKLLNPSGNDILRRTGFFPPAGDVHVEFGRTDEFGPSRITAVARGPFDTYSIADGKRNKIFTYDYDGNLLFAFSGAGSRLGLFSSIGDIVYQDKNILVTDRNRNSITVFEPTEYGNLIYKTIELRNQRMYSQEAEVWEEIMLYNNNFDIAYTGIGRTYMQEKNYLKAMDSFRMSNNVSEYSLAFSEQRKIVTAKIFLLIPLIAIVLALGLYRFSTYAKIYNKSVIGKISERSIKDQVMYTFHYIFHPFDGAWDLIREKRGGYKGALAILGGVILAFVTRSAFSGFILSGNSSGINILDEVMNLAIPFIVFCIANWSLTSLMDGEGSMKAIIVVTAYSLTPLILIIIPSTLISNFLTLEEISFYNLLVGIAYAWSGFLIFMGTLTIHNYSLPKNIITIILTGVGMIIIAFLTMLFFSLGSQILAFFVSLYREWSFRL